MPPCRLQSIWVSLFFQPVWGQELSQSQAPLLDCYLYDETEKSLTLVPSRWWTSVRLGLWCCLTDLPRIQIDKTQMIKVLN